MLIGEIRRAQLITTFGIGAIVDLPDHSVMIAGQDFWQPSLLDDIHEPRLEKKHGVSGFKQPEQLDKSLGSNGENPAVPAVRFPLWHFCPECRKLASLKAFGSFTESKCPKCSKPNDPKRLLPSRFVIACKNSHIDDFPWWWWMQKHGCHCANQRLEISTTGRTTSLAGITVKCAECSTQATLEGLFAPDALAGYRCTGQRPWLSDRQDCDERPKVVQRGSTSLYFPIRDSALSIPPFSTTAFHVLEKHWPTLRLVPEEAAKVVSEQLAKDNNVDVTALWAAYCHLKSYQAGEASPDIKYEEYIALCEPDEYNAKHDFAAVKASPPDEFVDVFSRVVLVKRLRMVTLLKAFSRLAAGDGNSAPLSAQSMDWLPAMEVNGEGVFMEFGPNYLTRWREHAGKALTDRANTLEERRQALLAQGRTTMAETITPEFLLVHTFSHILIRMLVNECGYSSAALSERVYARDEIADLDSIRRKQAMRGVLIYTASADSEGSLGGLVRQGEPDRMRDVLLGALEQARWCSNDPLCIESNGQGTDSRNLGACHACALLPETSCEYFNGFLDRGVLVGFPAEPNGGLFARE